MYKTEGWKDIKVGDKVEVLYVTYFRYGTEFPNPAKVEEVYWETDTEKCVAIKSSYGAPLSFLVGDNSADHIRPLKNPVNKYKSVQDLPIGTFVKFRASNLPIYCWGGAKQGLLSLAQSSYYSSFKDQVKYYEGFKYTPNSMYDIVSYSDKYDGEYVAIVDETVNLEVKKPDWKIKHIKSPSYKCGRDVACTILYRQVSDTMWEYKYAICSTADMFCRNTGVQIAKHKQESWNIATSKDILFREILRDIVNSKNGKVSVQFRKLCMWHNSSR